MANEFLPLGILFVLATGLAFLVVALGHMFGPRRPAARKAEPYESGMKPIGPGTRRMSVRFYLVAVLFKPVTIDQWCGHLQCMHTSTA